MNIDKIPSGKDIPNNFNVIIEIPAQSEPVKYEFDKESGALFVDRFVGTGMRYPCNYGFVPHTIAGDGDPVDVLVITPFPLLGASVVACRAIGILHMSDEGGNDAKVIAVPVDKVCKMTANIKSLQDVPSYLVEQIQHFFEQYKALEKGKWVKIEAWGGIEEAHQEIEAGVRNYSVPA
ncbi:MAG: inorganic pyrophosphatase [Pseudomonadota bacterium]|jgi:inorganic pyrophosphatase